MLIELHSHTMEHSSCSIISAGETVKRVISAGIDAVVFTDHHYLWKEDEISGMKDKWNIPADFPVYSGQEVTTPEFGDILVYGADISIKMGTSLRNIRESFPEAAIIWAHPFRWGGIPVLADVISGSFDAVEILNGNQSDEENRLAVSWWQKYRFKASGGSDTHSAGNIARFPTTFQVKVNSLNDLVKAVKLGRITPADTSGDYL